MRTVVVGIEGEVAEAGQQEASHRCALQVLAEKIVKVVRVHRTALYHLY